MAAQKVLAFEADVDRLEAKAGEAAAMLRLLANEKRLLILCHLLAAAEMTVTALARAVGLSQSALSQHLAKMRADGLVATRRDAQTIHYRVADARVRAILETLSRVFCPELKPRRRQGR